MPEERSKILFPVLVLLALVALVGGVWYAYRAQLRSEQPAQVQRPAELNSSIAFAVRGDSAVAAKVAGDYIKDKNVQDPYYLLGMSVRANTLTEAATTTDQMIDAVRAIKESYNTALPNSLPRASAVNTLIVALYRFKNGEVNAEAYKEEPFKALRVEGNDRASLKKLAEYSLSIYPTAEGYLYAARADAEALRDEFVAKRGSVPSKADVTKIVDMLPKADALMYDGSKNNLNLDFIYGSYCWQLFWKAYDLGVIAQIDPGYLPTAEKAYKAAFDYARMTKTPEGNEIFSVVKMGTEAHLAYAVMLYRVAGGKRAEDIHSHLLAFLDDVKKNPSWYSGYYSFFNKAKTASSGGKTSLEKLAYEAHLLYSELSKLSPELKAFLIGRGWNL